jgi:hypothetical protein
VTVLDPDLVGIALLPSERDPEPVVDPDAVPAARHNLPVLSGAV